MPSKTQRQYSIKDARVNVFGANINNFEKQIFRSDLYYKIRAALDFESSSFELLK